MKVQELIDKLKKLPPSAPVKVWDAYNDCETSNVVVSVTYQGEVFIMENATQGTEV